MTCPRCQASLADGARFCGACGLAFAPTETQGDTGAPGGRLAPAPEIVGREIAGRYRIVAKLGEGGMGAVFRAEQLSLKRAVALKLLRPELSSNAALLRRFNAEAELVAKLSHPNTVNIYDFGQDADGSLFIAMELIEGGSLRQLLRTSGPLPPVRALAIAAQLAASLADAHAHGIIHRDLKPDNVMLQERGRERDVVRLLDFGIAKLRDDARATQQMMTQAGDMLGTPQYMAPEQIRGEAVDGRTDVYALGCILYEMLTARMPFEATAVMALLSKHLLEAPVPPSVRRPDLGLSPALDELVLSAMAKPVAARPATMEAYGERIGALLRTMLPTTPGLAAGVATAPLAEPTARVPPLASPHAARSRTLPIALASIGGVAALALVIGVAVSRGASAPVSAPVAPDPAAPASADPWTGASRAGSAAPDRSSLPTALTEVPPVAELHPPFEAVPVMDLVGAQHWVDREHATDYVLAPMIPGTNDPQALARHWLSGHPDMTQTSTGSVASAGDVFTTLGFAGRMQTAQGPQLMVQLLVLYITRDYRLVLMVQTPATLVTRDPKFMAAIDEFLASGVDL